jgi:predicted metalloprotease with PDZ domain
MKPRVTRLLFAGLAGLTALAHAQPIPPVTDQRRPGVMTLKADVSDLDRKIFRVEQTVPVQPGPLVLFYPQWLPGNHSPSGNVAQLTGLQIRGKGQRIEWQRDTMDAHAFHLDVPAGVSTLDLRFEFVSPLDKGSDRITSTPDIVGLQWNTVLLYPAGHSAANIAVEASIALPGGWSFGSALDVASREGDVVRFKPVNVETLVDSPVFAGRHFKQVDLDPGARDAGRAPVRLNIVGDQARQLAATPEQLAVHRALVVQADKLFGARHYGHYDFLLALSENFSGIGLEHHQSSENGMKSNYFTEWSKPAVGRDLLAHEYVHSWNGKFRRPADLNTPNFNTPMQDSLLWVYEGQTQFWGKVLAARSGLMSPSDARDDLAMAAASLDARAGRSWRNLQDTTNEPVLSRRGNRDWASWQRRADYYDESRLVWLEADMIIRNATKGKRSLDDFARAFFGVEPGRMAPLTYVFDDVVRELVRVAPYDWAGFLRGKLDSHERAAPLHGLAMSGWRLAFSEKPSEFFKAAETRARYADFTHSLGIEVANEGDRITEVGWGSPAFEAGLAPNATLLAVNGRSYKAEWLRDVISDAKTSGEAIELLVKAGDLYRTVRVNYKGGLRYPKLERIDGTPDRLSELFAPK